uniref:Uncharacterized protein n=1 Tax=Arundo donax TaxID=35708 RepID=A0A0A8YAI2_ARUDO
MSQGLIIILSNCKMIGLDSRLSKSIILVALFDFLGTALELGAGYLFFQFFFSSRQKDCPTFH